MPFPRLCTASMMFVADPPSCENGHQDIHDELHGRIVIIVKQDLIHFRFCHLNVHDDVRLAARGRVKGILLMVQSSF